MLVVPSLINRWEVLDLTGREEPAARHGGAGPAALSRRLGHAQCRGAPLRHRRPMWRRLERALAFVTKRARRAPAVMGYCMGGTLTVALAARQPRRVAGLALMAAPGTSTPTAPATPSCCRPARCWRSVADQVGELPVDILQTLFWSLDPWLAVKKFGRFLGMDQKSDSAREFVLLEDWLNDGAPLAGPTRARMPGRLVWRQPARHRQVDRRRPAHRAVEDRRAVAGHDPLGRSHRAAAVGRGAGRSEDAA